jgi:hypothetical protein
MSTPSTSTANALYPIDECPELMADACVCDESGTLIFLSVWARDTAIQQFQAQLTLGRSQNGLDRFHLVMPSDGTIPVFVGSVDRLDKRITRVYRRTLFGSLVNLWLFDRCCVKPDKVTSNALALVPRSTDELTAMLRLWRVVQETCPLPLLDHWRDTVLKLLQDKNMLRSLPMALGPLRGFRVALDVPLLTRALGELIRADVLTTEPSLHTAPAALELLAA